MNIIESILREKVEHPSTDVSSLENVDGINEEGKVYWRQWEIAKHAVSEVLATISHYFPHFSLHDETHSIAILNNIVRIVGKETLQELSIVDLWMILIAAYYHDIGMTITGDELSYFVSKDSAFVDYVLSIQKDEHSPMSSYANCFDVKEGKLYHKQDQLTTENLDAHRFLIADFVRHKHASRSAEKVLSAKSLHLPGNPIPERIIKLVAKVCNAHTQSREELLKLPTTESSGCGIEDCHPLYVACLLRIGDLLDVDSNRVSSVLLSTLASIPIDSQAYNQTNRDITHILINQSVIEMTAECAEYRVAELLNSWFKMINDEISFQSKEWYRIAPNEKFRSLPAVGNMIVKLTGYDDITSKEKPKFEIDTNKAIEMLQGAGLYNDPSQSIRELLQNAVDATYLRVFMEHGERDMTIKDFEKKCADCPISISINKKSATTDDGDCWQIEISDVGLGMDREDVKFLTKTGSSSHNKQKQTIVNKMPAWMRPSGTFGIGFQSVFLITDKVLMRTRKWGGAETLELTMYNPTGTEHGNILQKTIVDNNIPFGTTLQFNVKSKKSSSWSVSMNERMTIQRIQSYDFAIESGLDVSITKLVDRIKQFADIGCVPLKLTFEDSEIPLSYNTNNGFDFYDQETGMQVAAGGGEYWSNGTSLYFRNQIVDKFRSSINFLQFRVNMLTEDAKDVLVLSRNDVNLHAYERIQTNMIKSVCRYVIKYYDNFGSIDSKDYRPYAAALLETYRNLMNDAGIDCCYPEDWNDIQIMTTNGTKTIKKLLSFDRVEILYSDRDQIYFYSGNNANPECEINQNTTQYELVFFLKKRFASVFKGKMFTQKGILLSKEKEHSIIQEGAASAFYDYYGHSDNYARSHIPCVNKYSILRIKNVRREHMLGAYGYEDYPIMVCPYVREREEDAHFFSSKYKLKYKVSQDVLEYVYQHRYDQSTTREQIAVAYEQYRAEYQPIIDELNQRD